MSKSSERVKAWRKATKQRMVAAMGGKCQCCGYDRCAESLDFHHVNPAEKEIGLGSVRANPKAWGAIVNELRKCILICRNCHGEVHHQGRQLPENYAQFDERYADFTKHQDFATPCLHCGKPKAPNRRHCSRSCAASSRCKAPIDWTQVNLAEMVQTQSCQQIADVLGCSHRIVSLHLREQGIAIPPRSRKAKRSFTPYVKAPKAVRAKVSDTDPNWRHRPNLKLRKVDRPLKEDLQRMVWEKSLLEIGKGYGVGDNTIRKWCKAYGVQWPPQGYWQRRKAGYSHEESLVSQKRLIKGKRFITREIAEQAFVLVQGGMSYRKAAAQFGFRHWGMQQAFERYGLQSIQRKAMPTGDAPV